VTGSVKTSLISKSNPMSLFKNKKKSFHFFHKKKVNQFQGKTHL